MMLNITFILWDAGIRDLHGVKTAHRLLASGFSDGLRKGDEVVFVDYYDTISPDVVALADKINAKDGARVKLITMNRPKDESWHIGEMVNHAVIQSERDGQIKAVIDADVGTDFNFRDELAGIFERDGLNNSIVHAVRYDFLDDRGNMKPVNLLNYGALTAISWDNYAELGGYRNDHPWEKDSAIACEFHSRAVNLGLDVRWLRGKVWHHNHPNSGIVSPYLSAQRQEIARNVITRRTDWRGQ